MNLPALTSTKWAVCLLCFVAASAALYGVLVNPESLPLRSHARYVAHLDRKLHSMLLPARGQWIFVGQLCVLELVALAYAAYGARGLWIVPAIVAIAPAFWIDRMRGRRLAAIEGQVAGFLLTLANALRATPSIGNALAYSEELLPQPMRAELSLALQELRVGSSVDQALMNLGARARSASVDAALLALFIGRQVGGDLTKVLESTAGTLREMARLRGVLRMKTAEGKAQMVLMALFPVLVVLGFGYAEPDFFEPLLSTRIGHYLIGIACVLWFLSLLVARKILAVRL